MDTMMSAFRRMNFSQLRRADQCPRVKNLTHINRGVKLKFRPPKFRTPSGIDNENPRQFPAGGSSKNVSDIRDQKLR
jgi:hypothetical protein